MGVISHTKAQGYRTIFMLNSAGHEISCSKMLKCQQLEKRTIFHLKIMTLYNCYNCRILHIHPKVMIDDFYVLCFHTESEEPVSSENMDEVCSEIGQEWRRLCRKMGFSDGECEQFRLDFHVSGTYEITYQVIAIVPFV